MFHTSMSVSGVKVPSAASAPLVVLVLASAPRLFKTLIKSPIFMYSSTRYILLTCWKRNFAITNRKKDYRYTLLIYLWIVEYFKEPQHIGVQ